MADETKTCPDCAESVKAAARKCRYCGYVFKETILFEQATIADAEANARADTGQSANTEEDNPEQTIRSIIGLSVAVFSVMLLFIWIFVDRGSEERNPDLIDKETVAKNLKGFHCLSWDGSNLSTVMQARKIMRNPDSFEHIETQIAPLDPSTGDHWLRMTYRAQNGFGGMSIEQMYARIDTATCDSKLLPDGPGSQ